MIRRERRARRRRHAALKHLHRDHLTGAHDVGVGVQRRDLLARTMARGALGMDQWLDVAGERRRLRRAGAGEVIGAGGGRGSRAGGDRGDPERHGRNHHPARGGFDHGANVTQKPRRGSYSVGSMPVTPLRNTTRTITTGAQPLTAVSAVWLGAVWLGAVRLRRVLLAVSLFAALGLAACGDNTKTADRGRAPGPRRVRELPPDPGRRLVAQHARVRVGRSGLHRDEPARPARDQRRARQLLRQVPRADRGARRYDHRWSQPGDAAGLAARRDLLLLPLGRVGRWDAQQPADAGDRRPHGRADLQSRAGRAAPVGLLGAARRIPRPSRPPRAAPATTSSTPTTCRSSARIKSGKPRCLPSRRTVRAARSATWSHQHWTGLDGVDGVALAARTRLSRGRPSAHRLSRRRPGDVEAGGAGPARHDGAKHDLRRRCRAKNPAGARQRRRRPLVADRRFPGSPRLGRHHRLFRHRCHLPERRRGRRDRRRRPPIPTCG